MKRIKGTPALNETAGGCGFWKRRELSRFDRCAGTGLEAMDDRIVRKTFEGVPAGTMAGLLDRWLLIGDPRKAEKVILALDRRESYYLMDFWCEETKVPNKASVLHACSRCATEIGQRILRASGLARTDEGNAGGASVYRMDGELAAMGNPDPRIRIAMRLRRAGAGGEMQGCVRAAEAIERFVRRQARMSLVSEAIGVSERILFAPADPDLRNLGIVCVVREGGSVRGVMQALERRCFDLDIPISEARAVLLESGVMDRLAGCLGIPDSQEEISRRSTSKKLGSRFVMKTIGYGFSGTAVAPSSVTVWEETEKIEYRRISRWQMRERAHKALIEAGDLGVDALIRGLDDPGGHSRSDIYKKRGRCRRLLSEHLRNEDDGPLHARIEEALGRAERSPMKLDLDLEQIEGATTKTRTYERENYDQ